MILMLLSLIMMAFGVFCFMNKDIAWMLYELDTRLLGVEPPARGANWRTNVAYAATALILLGMIGLNSGLQNLF